MKSQQSAETNPAVPSAEQAPELEMHKRVVKMADGKRDMIYFTFSVSGTEVRVPSK